MDRIFRETFQVLRSNTEAAQMYLLDDIESQRRGLGEHLDVDAVSWVLQDQTADVKPPTKREKHVSQDFSHIAYSCIRAAYLERHLYSDG